MLCEYRGEASYPNVSRARKILAELVERDAHDAVGGIEGLLDAIAVVNVDVDVQNALMVPA
jgi:hypothetical protein